MLTLFKRKKAKAGVTYIPLHYTKVVLPNGKVVKAVSIQDDGSSVKIVDLSGKVIIIGRG